MRAQFETEAQNESEAQSETEALVESDLWSDSVWHCLFRYDAV